jgi:hypothetical protein
MEHATGAYSDFGQAVNLNRISADFDNTSFLAIAQQFQGVVVHYFLNGSSENCESSLRLSVNNALFILWNRPPGNIRIGKLSKIGSGATYWPKGEAESDSQVSGHSFWGGLAAANIWQFGLATFVSLEPQSRSDDCC